MRRLRRRRRRSGVLARCRCRRCPPPSGSSNGIRWEVPPGRGGANRKVERFRPLIPELKRRPGEWARLFDYDKPTGAASAATKLRQAFPDFEIVGRRVEGGSAIFARFVEAED